MRSSDERPRVSLKLEWIFDSKTSHWLRRREGSISFPFIIAIGFFSTQQTRVGSERRSIFVNKYLSKESLTTTLWLCYNSYSRENLIILANYKSRSLSVAHDCTLSSIELPDVHQPFHSLDNDWNRFSMGLEEFSWPFAVTLTMSFLSEKKRVDISAIAKSIQKYSRVCNQSIIEITRREGIK